MSPVRNQPSSVNACGRGVRPLPVAAEDVGAVDLHGAAVAEPHAHAGQRPPDRAGPALAATGFEVSITVSVMP